MTPAQWPKIFNEQIVPMIGLDKATRHAHPRLLVVGAQPGAGKSAEIGRASAKLAGAVVINGDEYRPFHPQYEDFIKSDLATAAERTSDAVGYWVAAALEQARNRKCHVIMETTLRQPGLLSTTLGSFVAAGYAVDLRVVVVHPNLSRLGIYKRYLAAASVPGVAPRYSRRHYHEDALNNQSVTINALQSLLSSVILVNREGREIATHVAPYPAWAETLQRMRNDAITADQFATLCAEWQGVLQQLTALAAPDEIRISASAEVDVHCQ
jgi:hypothetical protein